ncbi:MAG TPA: decaprenyl-phosphate phosphoribosyltransferase [Polyangiaceae bacterium]|nr:decaprenyl-phosphate phosphoribosyltransferase [Polyangiaceae bacterium]
MLWRLGGLLLSVRPHQWVKNVFVLAPVVFAREIFDPMLLARAAGAFFIFCLLAGAVYTLNDMADIEADRAHPIKRYRPIASGRVLVPAAKQLLFVLLLFSVLGTVWLGSVPFAVSACGYFFLNLTYSLRLKHVAYLDVVLIASGFVLRVMAGGFATKIEVSGYLLACTALLALFLGFGKRRHELSVAQARSRKAQRASLESYSARGLDLALGATGVLTVACYVAYTLDARTIRFFRADQLWVTALFVVLGVLRFLFLVRHRTKAESPTQEMLRDGPFVAIVLIWIGVVFWIVYNLRPN